VNPLSSVVAALRASDSESTSADEVLRTSEDLVRFVDEGSQTFEAFSEVVAFG
jgi:hypothetical protein